MKSRMPDPTRQKTIPIRRGSSSKKTRWRSLSTGKSPIFKSLQLLAIATTGGAIMLASIAGIAFLRSGSQFMEGVKLAITPKPAEDTVDVRTVVVEQVREVSELTTAIFTMEAVVPAQSDRKLGEFTVGKTNLLYVAYGEVRAGVDLEALETADVTTSETGDTEITLTLPSPTILDTKIDVDRSNVYDYNRGFLNLGPDRGVELTAMAQKEAKVKIVAAACEQNILNQANDRAELVVGQLLRSAGFDNVVIQTTPGTACQALS